MWLKSAWEAYQYIFIEFDYHFLFVSFSVKAEMFFIMSDKSNCAKQKNKREYLDGKKYKTVQFFTINYRFELCPTIFSLS